MKEAEKCLDSRLWHACAGSMVQMPLVNSKVFYFPQGHAEHALANVDFGSSLRIPAIILCRVAAVKFMADPENDEVYTKIMLVPLANNKLDYDDDGVLGSNGSATHEKPVSFAKSLTQSDANNGGGFSVPRYCAETIFPPLDYSADPPVQTLIAKDIHGEIWKFRHIYRGTPRRHLLTTGWSNFVNQKKLVAGDSIVFLRAENGDLCIGIRRAKRAIVGAELPSGWNSDAANSVSKYGGYSVLLREDDKLMRSGNCGNLNSSGLRGRGRVRRESVKEAVALASKGQPFEIVYYPHASTPEFCIKASSVKAAMRIHWCSGMRFKMAFETEDSSRISWFMGTIASVRVADPFHWPNSPWRLLQVTWDEPDLLQNVKCVSPWLVELVSNMPILHQSPFSPPRKKLRFLEHHPDIPLASQFPFPSFSGNHLVPSSPLCCLSDNISAGIQGARHAQFGILLPDIHLKNKLHLGLVPSSFQLLSPHNKLSSGIPDDTDSNDNVSCLLTMGNAVPKLEKKDNLKKPQFLLFGQPILTEQQISSNCSADVSQVSTRKCSSAGSPEKAEKSSFDLQALPENISSTGFSWHQGFCTTELDLDTCHCEVFMESEDLGQTIDLSVFGCYEELNRRLANMLGIEGPEMPCHVLYRDAAGAVKQTGDEPFSDFMKTAKRLTILQDSGSKGVGRNRFAGLGNAETGLDSSIPTGPLGIFT